MDHKKIRLSYKESGEGLPVFLLHGFPFDHTIWDETASILSRSARIICPDLRGHGHSPDPPGLYTMETMAEDISHLMDHLNIASAVMVGHSMGGYISLAFLELFPQKILGLGLVASHAGVDSPERRQARYQTLEALRSGGSEVLVKGMPVSLSDNPLIQDRIRKLIRSTSVNGLIGSVWGMAERKDRTGLLPAVLIPVLVIAGDQDRILPADTARKMAHLAPGGKFEIIQGTGHMPMLESPESFSKILGQFIQKIENPLV